MRPIATSDPVAWCVGQTVCLPVSVKTTERITILFGMGTLRDPRHIVLDGGPDSPTAREGRRKFNAAFVKLFWPFATAYNEKIALKESYLHCNS